MPDRLVAGKIITIFEIDNRDFKRKLRENNKGLNNITKSSKQSSKGIAGFSKSTLAMGAAVGAGVVVLKKLADNLLLVASSSLKSYAAMEKTQVQFETMIGNVRNASALFKDLVKFSAKTPFEFTDVSKAARVLLAFGFELNEINSTLKVLSDVSAGTGKNLSELAIIFGKIKGNGKLMGQELNMLIDSGFSPLKIMSEQTGLSINQLRDEMRKGNISFKMVEDAFKKVTSEGGMFNNAADKLSQTLSGKWSTAMSNINLILAEFGKVLAPAAKDILDKFNASIDDLYDKDGEFKLKEEFEEFAIAIRNLPNFADTMREIVKSASDIVKLFKEMSSFAIFDIQIQNLRNLNSLLKNLIILSREINQGRKIAVEKFFGVDHEKNLLLDLEIAQAKRTSALEKLRARKGQVVERELATTLFKRYLGNKELLTDESFKSLAEMFSIIIPAQTDPKAVNVSAQMKENARNLRLQREEEGNKKMFDFLKNLKPKDIPIIDVRRQTEAEGNRRMIEFLERAQEGENQLAELNKQLQEAMGPKETNQLAGAMEMGSQEAKRSIQQTTTINQDMLNTQKRIERLLEELKADGIDLKDVGIIN